MDSTQILVALTGVLVLGIGSQWLASRLKLPSILLLLAAGVVAGPVTGFLNPEELLGDLLVPMVSLAIAVILFEGAMTLQLSELKSIGRPLLLLLTVGVFLTGVLTAIGAYQLLQLGAIESILLGTVLTVTGPTVVGPLLHHIRPIGKVGPLARWEGIVVDPIGAILAVLTFATIKAVETAKLNDAAMSGVIGFGATFFVGAVLGLISAWCLREVLKRHWVSDHLDSPLSLALVLLTFTSANLIHHEAGLVAVTVMGLVLANQHQVSVARIIDFKENLTVLLIGSLFVVLAARLDLNSVAAFGWRGFAFLAFMVLFVRPVSVMASTMGCGLPMAERLFLSWLAPRGIVAAAVASVFSAELPNGSRFVAAAFVVIIGTVVVYGLTAGWVARKLGLSIANPQGVLIASAHPAARAIALALKNLNIPVRMVDTNRANIRAAQMEGLPTFFGNILSEKTDSIDLGGIGRLFAMTRNSEVNILAIHRGEELFERKECYRLSIPVVSLGRSDVGRVSLTGRVLFAEDATYDELDRRFAAGEVVKSTKLSEEFTLYEFRIQYPNALLMFAVDAAGKLTVLTTDSETEPVVDQTVVAIVAE